MIRRRSRKDRQPGMTDIHCHILPGLDDGARDIQESLSMLRIAAAEGITDMIATPHFRAGGHSAPPERVLNALWEVQDAAAEQGIPIRLYPGNEIRYFDGLPQCLLERQALTLNRSQYVLVEFSPSDMFRTLHNGLGSILDAGYQPVLAHAERYECLRKDISNVEFLSGMGVQIQVNASAVTGKNGAAAKRYVHQLLGKGLVDYVGTDAHGSRDRTPEAAGCAALLGKRYGISCADALLRGNAERILE